MPASYDSVKFPQSIEFMIIEFTSFSYWVPHTYIFKTLLWIAELFELIVPVICYLQTTSLIINNLWNLSLLWVLLLLFQQHVPDVGSIYYCQDVWSEKSEEKLETRARLQGGWLVALLLFCAVHVKIFQLWFHTRISFKVWLPSERAVQWGPAPHGRPWTKPCPNPHLFKVPWSCIYFSFPHSRSQKKTRMMTDFFCDGQVEIIIISEHQH